MINSPEQILYSDISRIMYEQAKRLLAYINDNLKGKEITIKYEDDQTAMMVDFLKNETLQINIEYTHDSSNSYRISLYKHSDPEGYESSLFTNDGHELYDYMPGSLRDAFRKCIRRKEDVVFIL
jgi:hypothetical protein